MIKVKRLITLIIVLVIAMGIIPLFTAYANRQVTIYINGRRVNFEGQQAVIVNNRVLIPLRGTFEHMGYDVNWYSRARMARLIKGDVTIIVPADVDVFVVNDEIIVPDVPQQIIDGRLMLPLRAVSEAIGATVRWNNTSRVAHISYAPSDL